jgi:hypothetical protein
MIVLFQNCSSKQSLSKAEKEKLDPFLRLLVLDEEIDEDKYSIYQQEDGTILYGVLIQTTDVEEINKTGIQINSENGNIITAKLTLQDIRRLVTLKSVVFINNSTKNKIH